MIPLRSLRNKVAILFFLITTAAFAAIYFIVLPQLEQNLKERRLASLEAEVKAAKPVLEALVFGDLSTKEVERRARAVSDSTDARVTLLDWDVSHKGPQTGLLNLDFYPIFDSSEQRAYPHDDGLTRKALRTRRLQRAFTRFKGEEIGMVVQPLLREGVPTRAVIYTLDLEDVRTTVSFVRNRVLLASFVALLIALVGGWLVADQIARRVRRLEQAAADVAGGSFSEPLPVDSEDELGQLTRAFNRMGAQLREVDVARKEFIATASHELRTPIFSLGGFVELLQDEDLDEETRREFLETMGEQVARLQKLSVDLLDLSRLDAGSVELQTEPVDLSELARSIVGEFRPAISDHRTALAIDLPEVGPDARCDRERVAQIMRILLDNALRHTPEGTDVTVRAHRDNGAAGVTVADTGPGLPLGTSTKVFERFYTGDAARGAGLGLAIARELAERMDGRLELSSEPGSTRFTLVLPAGGLDR